MGPMTYYVMADFFHLSTDDIYRVPLMSSSGSEYINASFINVGIFTDVFTYS